MKRWGYVIVALILAIPFSVNAESAIDYGTMLDITIDPYIPPEPLVTLQESVYAFEDYDTMKLNVSLQDLANFRRASAWSPDGQWIGMTSMNQSLWITPSNGGNPILLDDEFSMGFMKYAWNEKIKYWYQTKDDTKNDYFKNDFQFLEFSPDGSELLYTTYIYDTSRGSFFSGNKYSNFIPSIESVNIQTGEHRTVIAEGMNCDFSADGRYLAYMNFDSRVYTNRDAAEHCGDVAVLDLVTGSATFLTNYNEVLDNTYYNRCQAITISPDNSTVAFAKSGQIYMVHFVPWTGEEAVQVSSFENWGTNQFITTLEYSPDGKWLIFERCGSLVIMNVETKSFFWALTGDPYEPAKESLNATGIGSQWMPSFSPDGTEICYTKRDAVLYTAPFTSGEFLYKIAFDPEKYSTGKDTPILVETESPQAFGIEGNYPNPFNPATTIDFTIGSTAEVSLAIYNSAGQKVRSLVNMTFGAGKHSVVWDGCDDTGSQVSSGVYIARLRSGNNVASRQMMLMK